MAHDTGPAMGMSVGATTLAAVTANRGITRRPVLTLVRDRLSQIGVPSENPGRNSATGGPGLVITDFVDRVGDSAPVVATDGSAHRAEQLLADGLHALAFAATEGGSLPPAVAVTHPVHWSRSAVDALRTALARVSVWSQRPVSVISDVSATLTALQASPGLPASGVIAMCDFGGSGTSVTLVDAGRNFQPIGATLRHTAFSGDVIDQALLDHVVADLSSNNLDDGPPTVGSLTRLRSQCRNAKEQLSLETVAELGGFHDGAWLTRVELDEAIRQPLEGFFSAMRRAMADNGIRAEDLSAIISVGGGANIPAVTTGLSQRFNVAVVSSPRPQLTAAIGAALGVAGNLVATATTSPPNSPPAPAPKRPPGVQARSPVVAPPAPVMTPPAPMMTPAAPAAPRQPPVPAPPRAPAPAPPPAIEEEPDERGRGLPVPWYRRTIPVILAAALVTLLIGTLAVVALRHAAKGGPADENETRVSTTTSTSATSAFPPAPAPAPAPAEAPAFPGVAPPPPAPEIPAVPPAPPVPEITEAPLVP